MAEPKPKFSLLRTIRNWLARRNTAPRVFYLFPLCSIVPGIANTRSSTVGAVFSVRPRNRLLSSDIAPSRPPRMNARRTATTSSFDTVNITAP